MSPDRVTVDDIIRIGGCAFGIRRWFTARGDDLPEGVSFKSFMANGMSIDQARECQDYYFNLALAKRGMLDV